MIHGIQNLEAEFAETIRDTYRRRTQNTDQSPYVFPANDRRPLQGRHQPSDDERHAGNMGYVIDEALERSGCLASLREALVLRGTLVNRSSLTSSDERRESG